MCNQDVVDIISCLMGSDTSKHHCEAAVRQSVARLTQYGMMTIDAPVAQWIEHLTSDQGVASSNLAWCAIVKPSFRDGFLCVQEGAEGQL